MLDTRRNETPNHTMPETGRSPAPRASLRLDDPIGIVPAVVAGAAWIVLTWISVAVQPPPADPNAQPDGLALLLSTVWTMLLFASIAGIAIRQRWGLLATFGGGVLMIGASTYCYATGHTGVWLATQFVAGVGLAATGAVLARHA